MTRTEIANALESLGYGAASVPDAMSLIRISDAVRRLPVIATCGECGYESLTSDADGYEASVCTKSGPRQWSLVRADKEPPTWCPLRGAR